MDSRTRLQAALFGVKNGVAWVADDVFVTRSSGDIVVEGWVGRRLASILVARDDVGVMRTIWAKLNEVATDEAGSPQALGIQSAEGKV